PGSLSTSAHLLPELYPIQRPQRVERSLGEAKTKLVATGCWRQPHRGQFSNGIVAHRRGQRQNGNARFRTTVQVHLELTGWRLRRRQGDGRPILADLEVERHLP